MNDTLYTGHSIIALHLLLGCFRNLSKIREYMEDDMEASTLERKFGKLTFSNPLVYGGGTCKTLDDVKELCRSAAAGMEVGTITPHFRAGNSAIAGGQLFYAVRRNGILIATYNSLGMPNPGKDAWTVWAKEAIAFAHDHGKLIGMNVSGDTPEEIVMMVLWALELGFDWVTINGGCPNKFKDGIPQAILSFDEDDLFKTLSRLSDRAGRVTTPVLFKPSPMNDTLGLLPRIGDMAGNCITISGWAGNNTVPHCFALNEKNKPAIAFGDGRAGMGGPATKGKAMGDLISLRKRPSMSHLDFAFSGGITYGPDILEAVEHGAAITMFTSAHWAEDLSLDVPHRMLTELTEIPDLEKRIFHRA